MRGDDVRDLGGRVVHSACSMKVEGGDSGQALGVGRKGGGITMRRKRVRDMRVERSAESWVADHVLGSVAFERELRAHAKAAHCVDAVESTRDASIAEEGGATRISRRREHDLRCFAELDGSRRRHFECYEEKVKPRNLVEVLGFLLKRGPSES